MPAVSMASSTTQQDAKVIALFPFQVLVSEELAGVERSFGTLLRSAFEKGECALAPAEKVQEVLEQADVDTLDVAAVRTLLQKMPAEYALYGKLEQQGELFSITALLVPKQGKPQEFNATSIALIEINSALNALMVQVRSFVYKEDTVSSILIRGNTNISSDAILSRLPLSVGEIPTKKSIDAAVKLLWSLGYFSDIQVEENTTESGKQLVFTVQEFPRIGVIELVGNKELSTKNIRELLVSKVGDVVNKESIAEEKRKILEEYRKKGFYKATVQDEIVPDPKEKSKAILRFTFNEGARLYIDSVVINGAKSVKPSVLRKNFAIQPRTLLSLLTGTGVLQDEFLERDSTVLLSELLNRGFFDAKVFPPEVKIRPEGLVIVFNIIEGPRYRVKDVSYKGDLLFSVKKLRSLAHVERLVKKKEYFNYSVMQEDAQRIAKSYGEYGFAFADVIPVTNVDREKHEVSIVYTITRGEKVYIRKTVLEGNTKTRDNVILRDLFLADGDVYNSKLLGYSKDRLARTGYFESVETEIVPTSSPSEVDLKITVKERSTGSFNFGVGFSTYSKFGISASLSERNLFGKGYYGAISASISSKQSLYSLSFTNPRLYDTNLGVGFDLYNLSDEYPDFTRNSTGGRVRLSYPLGYFTTLYASYTLEYYTITDIFAGASPYLRSFAGSQWGSTLNLEIVRNTTDSYSFPSRGTISRLSLSYGGKYLGGDNNFFSVSGEYQFFIKIVEPQYVFHVKNYGIAILNNGTGLPIPIFEREYIGGINTVRGYTITDMSPYDSYRDSIGGVYAWYANVEFVWLVLPQFGFAIVPFYDVGFNYDPKYAHGKHVEDYIKQSVGLELRWQSPLGLLRLAYGYPLNKDVFGKRLDGRFEFSIGSFF